MHDTQHGNGKALAELMAKGFPSSYDVTVGDVKSTSPLTVAQDSPQLLILGGAIRMFQGAPQSKKWLKELSGELTKTNTTIPYGAAFLTHMLSASKVRGYAKRFLNKLTKSATIDQSYNDCLLARVKEMEGPFVEGELEKSQKFVEQVVAWAQL